ncbi:MAG: serine hydrolase [Kordiimonadaceae bacterium]|nr:serine hydrolase [Kordiimonadaceae bacterium]
MRYVNRFLVFSLLGLAACDNETSDVKRSNDEQQSAIIAEQLSMSQMADSIHKQLENQVVGYSFALGNNIKQTGSGGMARTQADGSPIEFSADTPIIIASVSKFITAIATLRILDEKGLSVDDVIGPYFPGDWTIDPYIKGLTFAQLLRQTSGIKDSGNGPMPYVRLQAFYSRPVDPEATADCHGKASEDTPLPITPNNVEFCYSNYNAAILAILLPRLAGLKQYKDQEKRAQTHGYQYESLVKEMVFAPVGVGNVGCAPIGDDYAYSYIYPGDQPGLDWGIQFNRCAEGGWYLSALDLWAVLSSVAQRDGRILKETGTYSSFKQIRERRLGLDRSWPTLIEKGGLLGDDAGVLSTSAIIFQPDASKPIPAILLINSNGTDGKIVRARSVLQKAYKSIAAQN